MYAPALRLSAAVSLVLLLGCSSDQRLSPSATAEPEKTRRVGTGLTFAADTLVEATPRRVAGARFDDERVWGGEDDWEPFVAVDPDRGHVYQFTTRWVDGLYRILFRRSLDGGATWEADRQLFPSGIGQADPYAKVDDDGTLYAVWLENWDSVVARSDDFGESWTTPVAANGTFAWSDYPSLAVSDSGQDVYVAFNLGDSYFAASHDFGETFASPVKTNSDFRYWWHGGGAVAPDGDVYFGVTSMQYNALGPVDVYVIRSRDGGQSWQEVQIETSAETPDCEWAPGCEQGFLLPTVGLAVDVAGQVLVAYNAGPFAGEPQQIWTRTSLDGGETWSGRKRLSMPSLSANNAFPAVAAGPAAGDFRVVWQGDVAGDTDAWNTWYRRTTDGGMTWGPPSRLSNLATGAPYKSPKGYAFPYGDYMAIAVDDAGVDHVIWGEGISWLGPGGTWYTRGSAAAD